MISWMMFNFQNFNSLNMMLLHKLMNYIILIIIMILILIIYMNIYMFMNLKYNKKLIENNKLEFIWTILPFIIILILIIPSIKILYMNNNLNYNNILTIKIISNQWFWNFEYLNFKMNFNSYIFYKYNFHFYMLESSESLVLPVNYNIQFIFSSFDVIHSFNIPSMNIKMDLLPNQLNSINLKFLKPGINYATCTELCGINHSIMPLKIEIIEMKNFLNWLKKN